MAKSANKSDAQPVEAVKSEPENASDLAPTQAPGKIAKSPPAAGNTRKDGPARSKKQTGAAARNGSIIPSAEKLEHLKAAVSAAGNADNLLLILNHVEQAGGKLEVEESVEAFRLLKAALEE